jgi:hypothetical protein
LLLFSLIYVQTVDLAAVKEASAGATLFYAWVQSVLEEHHQSAQLKDRA